MSWNPIRCRWPGLLLALLAAACGDSLPSQAGLPLPPPDFPGADNQVPTAPAPGQSRAGSYYDIYLQAPTAPEERIAITVFEPAQMEGGKHYPLVLEQHGFGGSRQTDPSPSLTSALLSGISVEQLIAAGYGVISIDQSGHGESTGLIRAMDPDYEGKKLLAVLDWAEAKLPWLARGADLDGGPDNLVVGAVGPSYGGAFQLILNDIDPRKRLDALAPQITYYDLPESLFPNGVVKSAWVTWLYAVGSAAGSGADRANFDPYATEALIRALTSNAVNSEDHDFYHYHSNAYFCEGRPVATNGGPGTAPDLAPVAPGAVHALLLQGMRDTLFNFNAAYQNYQCLRRAGGDVRMLTYEGGHNSLLLVPDPGALVYQGVIDGAPGATLTRRCGLIDQTDAVLAFFEEHLKGIAGAADQVVPREPCLSLGADDSVLVAEVLQGKQGSEFAVPSSRTLAGLMAAPTIVDLGYTAPGAGAILAGIPYAELEIRPVAEGLGREPIVFVGLGRYRLPAGAPPPLGPPLTADLIDNQITPLRGYGKHALDLVGVGERLAPGDRLVLLIYGGHDQYYLTGALNLGDPDPALVEIDGRVWLPLL